MKIHRNLMGTCLMLLSVTTWSAGFNDNGNDTITDFATGLMWQQSDAHNNSTRTHDQAIAYCNDLSLTGNGNWRVPEVKELSTIVDYRRFSPSIESAYFPETISEFYWSASSYANDNSLAWLINFNGGLVTTDNKTNAYYVRCVR